MQNVPFAPQSDNFASSKYAVLNRSVYLSTTMASLTLNRLLTEIFNGLFQRCKIFRFNFKTDSKMCFFRGWSA